MEDPERLAPHEAASRSDRGPLPASVALLALVLGLLGMTAVSGLGMFGLRPGLLLGQLALIAPFWLSARALGVPAREAFALRGLRWRDVAFSVGCGLGLWIGSAGLMQLQYAVWPLPAHVLDFFQRFHAKLELRPPWEAALSMLAIAVGPAVSEEIAFRGAVLGSLRPRLGDLTSVLVTAALFAAIHFPPGGYRIPFTFVLGCALGVLRLHTGSLLPVIAAHAVLNATTVIIANRLGDVTAPTEPGSIGSGAAALGVGFVVTVAFAWGLRRGSPAGTAGIHSTR